MRTLANTGGYPGWRLLQRGRGNSHTMAARWSLLLGALCIAVPLSTLNPGLPAYASGRVVTTSNPVSIYSGPGISNPYGITAGPDGALWFTNNGNN